MYEFIYLFYSFQNHISELQRLAPRRVLFNDQAASLMENSPDTRPEVSWRVQHLNAKWVAVEAALLGNSGQQGAYGKSFSIHLSNIKVNKLVQIKY